MSGVGRMLDRVYGEEAGQATVEYTLLLAFVVLASAALLVTDGAALRGIWTGTSTLLSQGYSTAS